MFSSMPSRAFPYTSAATVGAATACRPATLASRQIRYEEAMRLIAEHAAGAGTLSA